MTEQPVETEQQFLGNETSARGTVDYSIDGPGLVPALPKQPIQHYVPNAHHGRFSPLRDKAKKDIQDAIAERAALLAANPSLRGPAHEQAILDELAAAAAPIEDPKASPNTDLQLEAEVHAGHAARSLENGELDAGIAWLQSALAFAQNARHSREFGILEVGALR